jgi:hypothetical protein
VSGGFDSKRIFVVKSLKEAAEMLTGLAEGAVVLFENDLPDNFDE